MKPSSCFIIIAFIFIGCAASADVLMLDESQQYPPSENVLLLFEEPSTPHIVIAIIEGRNNYMWSNPNETKILEEIRKKAREIGAHAIIPIDSEQRYVNLITTKAVALRFIEE